MTPYGYSSDPLSQSLGQQLEEKANELVALQKANIEVIKSLKGYYLSLVDYDAFKQYKAKCADDITAFARHLDNTISNMNMHLNRTKYLLELIHQRREMVSNRLWVRIV
jgi:hypothetical protein